MSTARVSIPILSTEGHEPHHQASSSSSPNTGIGNGAVQSRQVSASDATTPAAWRKPQWEAKVASFQRGLMHVMHCTSSDACGSSLCHSTRRLMRTYATHGCQKREGMNRVQGEEEERVGGCNNSLRGSECKVCKLMSFMMSTTTDGRCRDRDGRNDQQVDHPTTVTPIPTMRRVSRLLLPQPIRPTSRLFQLHTSASIDVIKSMHQRF